jgi:hypothetical protein
LKSRYDPELPVYFLHIPKTAGVSINSMLAGAFRNEEICPVGHWDDIARIPTNQIGKYRVFSGHYSAYLSRFLGKKLNIFTFFRDPLERTLSLYGFIRQSKTHPVNEAARTRTLREFILDPATRSKVVNFQARYIADLGFDPRKIAQGFTDRDARRYEFQMHFDDQSASVSSSAVRDAALRALDSFFFVGTTEKLNEASQTLSDLMGVRFNSPERQNVTEKRISREELDAETLAAIHEATIVDREIYEIVKSRE